MMTAIPKSVKVETLRYSLVAASNLIRELDSTRVLVRLAEKDRTRWEPVLDALSLTMEQAPGTLAATLAAVAAALED